MFIASIVLVVAVVLFTGCYALFQIGTNLLKGAASNGNSKIYHYSDSGEVSVTSDCKLAVQVDIENRTNSAVNITSAKLAKHSNHGKTNYATINYNKKIAAGKGKKVLVEYKFPLDKFPGAYSIAVVTYFNIGGTRYWKDESIDLSSSVIKKINSCKSTTKTVAGINGWKKESGNWYYYTSGKKATGWKQIKYSGSNKWFYFDKTNGYAYKNVCKTIDSKQYCFDNDGVWKEESDGNNNNSNWKPVKCTKSTYETNEKISCTVIHANENIYAINHSYNNYMK